MIFLISVMICVTLCASPLRAQEVQPSFSSERGADLQAEPLAVRAVYFTETGCKHCDAFILVQKQRFEQEFGVRLELETYDILSAEGYRRCVDMLAERGLPFTVFPVLFIGNNVYRGSAEIEEHVPLELAALRDTRSWRPAVMLTDPMASSSALLPVGPLASSPSLSPTGLTGLCSAGKDSISSGSNIGRMRTVFFAGLLDGINPCAFSTLLFFLSFISLRRQDRRSRVLVGLSFIGAVFLAYFLIGFGFLQVLRSLLSAGRATSYIRILVSVLAAILVALNLRDAWFAQQGRVGESALQLPAPLKRLSHQVIRFFSVLPLYVLGAALAGFLVSVIELACTGQVYLPTLVYMNQSAVSSRSISLLLLYNLGFILPLSLVFLLFLFGLRHERLRTWYGRRIVLVRLLTAALFTVLAVLVWI
ncbi:MAG: cytochrome c biogenesis protein CcdA [Termitinemataceae bacterium]